MRPGGLVVTIGLSPDELDALTRSMIDRGRQMAGRYKESSLGGIAVNVADC